MVALYALFVIISAIVSPYRENLLWGLNQSNMGLAAQFMFIFIYFITSRIFDMKALKALVYASLAASAAVSVIGILQRFGYDIFDLYHGLGSRLFLSTIGHYTYFSAYLILFYMLGVYAMWISDQGSAMHKAAAWLVIVSVMPCILNADMFFSGLFFALSFLFVLPFESPKRLKAFFEIALIILLTWRVTGIVWMLAKPEFHLEPLPQFIMQSPYLWIPVLCLALVYIFIRKKAAENAGFDLRKYRRIGYIYAGLVGFAMLATLVYIILNTKRLLPEGLRSSANYLLFDAFWGNGRGAIWHDSIMSFLQELKVSPVTAIFGAGPDQFVFVLDQYAHEWLIQYSDRLALFAHNEWVNAFICFGVFGGMAYLGIFISALIRFVRNREGAPAALGAAVIIVAYLSHQMFGYQQYISTPYIFLILGIGEQAVRERNRQRTCS